MKGFLFLFAHLLILLCDIFHMVSHSFKICQHLCKNDSALRFTFSFFHTLHLFLKVLISQIIDLLLCRISEQEGEIMGKIEPEKEVRCTPEELKELIENLEEGQILEVTFDAE